MHKLNIWTFWPLYRDPIVGKKIHETVISCSNNKQSYPFQWTHKMKKNFASKKSE